MRTRAAAAPVSPDVARLVRAIRYEVIPTRAIESRIVASVPLEIPVTVTASPAQGIESTVDLAERLAGHGYRVVPHLSARLVRDKAHLAELVERLRAAGVDDVFLPAGDADPPAGVYDAALPALRDLSDLGSPFSRVGITGYPESHPFIGDDVTVQAMWDKRAHATYIVSNLCFDGAAVGRWIARIRRRGITLPVRIGLAGPVARTKLLSMATAVGVGESRRFLTQHAGWFARLAAPGYTPDRLLARVARDCPAATSGIEGLHIFTFNQVAETEAWRRSLLNP